MTCNEDWNLERLRSHAGECRLLGDGGVAVVFEFTDTSHVRVTFFLYEKGQFKQCAADTGDAQALIKLLKMYDNTDTLARCHRRSGNSFYSAVLNQIHAGKEELLARRSL